MTSLARFAQFPPLAITSNFTCQGGDVSTDQKIEPTGHMRRRAEPRNFSGIFSIFFGGSVKFVSFVGFWLLVLDLAYGGQELVQ